MKQYIFSVLNEIFNNQIDDPSFPCSVDPAKLSESTQHLLSAYVEAQLDGRDAADLFPDVHIAIEQFAEFAEEYEMLYELFDAERKGELEEPPTTPIFDFSYLDLPPAQEPALQQNGEAASSLLDKVETWTVQLSESIVGSLQAVAQVRQSQHPAFATRSTDSKEWQTWFSYRPLNPPTDLNVNIAFKHRSDESEFCNVVVNVDVPSRGGWPNLADSQVLLSGYDGADRSGVTDPFGEVLFEGVKKSVVPQLAFAITPVSG